MNAPGPARSVDTEDEVNAFLAFEISEAFMAIIMAIVLPLEFSSLWEFHKVDKVNRTALTLRLRWSLFLNGVFASILIGLAISTAALTGFSPPVCDFLAKAIAMIYLIGLIFAYLFLLQKVRLVAKFETQGWYQKLFQCTEYTLAGMMPACLVLYAWVTTGKLTPEGRCMQIDPQWTYWVFSVGNAVLSSILVYLFVHPLRKMAAMYGSHSDFRQVYKRNVLISSFGVFVTFSAVFSYGILHYYAELLERDELNVIGMLLVGWDSFVLAMCCRLTTSIWLPSKVANCFECTSPLPAHHGVKVIGMGQDMPLTNAIPNA